MQFALLDDSPMFRQQIQCLEENSELLRGRCLKFYKGCRKYTEGLGEGYDNEIGFINALENFGGGNDPLCVAFGGPVMTKFSIALRELGTYKEVQRSMVETMLNDKLQQFLNTDMVDAKEARKRFDKASLIYDQAREKFLSLRKSTKTDVAAAIEEIFQEMHAARSSFEQARFSLVSSLSNIEAKTKFEFLEAVTGTMNAHLQFFKQAYELLHHMEPYINQVLTYTQQSRECSNYEQASLNERMQEYIRQIDRDNKQSLDRGLASPTLDGTRPLPRSSQKVIEAIVESSAKGKVQTIRQGYLSKRSSNLRADWKRRFFVLDSQGMLYYYRKPLPWSSATGSQSAIQRSSTSENGSGFLSRWLSSHYHGSAHEEKSVARHTVNLLTSTIKVDADQSDLRFCFRIISPAKIYTLQAENALDQMDWIEKINGVIASLLSIQTTDVGSIASPKGNGDNCSTSDTSSILDVSDAYQSPRVEQTLRTLGSGNHLETARSWNQQELGTKSEKTVDILRKVPGNDKCADCGAPDPDWASLNLGILVCIECSGIHRNLGVHISKVRSLTLDVKVWEPSVIALFNSLGNTYANSVWEESLHSESTFSANDSSSSKTEKHNAMKPSQNDPLSVRGLFIHAKYAEKAYVCKMDDNQHLLTVAREMWESVGANDKKAVYHHIVCSRADVNAIHGPASYCTPLRPSSKHFQAEKKRESFDLYYFSGDSQERRGSSCQNSPSKGEEYLIMDCSDGCSLLHLACLTADIAMVELLLQYGANINAADSGGRTPLHYCIISRKSANAKLLIARGADTRAVDSRGHTALQLASASGFDDEEVTALLKQTD